MEGLFRQRTNTVYCPKPVPAQDFEIDGTSYHFKAKKYRGWTNVDNCRVCEFLDELHLDNEGVFCKFPSKAFLKHQKQWKKEQETP